MKDMGFANKEMYENPDVIKLYSSDKQLQKPEETILNILKNQLPSMKMLDIGVGTGRTTLAFAPLAKEYVGVDYSEGMIKACQEQFQKADSKISFAVCDARAMTNFKDNTFDFILFSFNGIDYMSHADREKTLKEIKRVAKADGIFCFSTHSTLCIEKYLSVSLCLNPLWLLKIFQRRWKVQSLIRAHNGLEHISYSVIKDGEGKFKIETHYINPLEQIKILKETGFYPERVFAETTVDEVVDHSLLKQMKKDRWFYFLTTIHKP